jgi:hypothetical protein
VRSARLIAEELHDLATGHVVPERVEDQAHAHDSPVVQHEVAVDVPDDPVLAGFHDGDLEERPLEVRGLHMLDDLMGDDRQEPAVRRVGDG